MRGSDGREKELPGSTNDVAAQSPDKELEHTSQGKRNKGTKGEVQKEVTMRFGGGQR